MVEHRLPRVSKEFAEEFLEEVLQKRKEDKGPELLLQWQAVLERENPALFELMRGMAQKHVDLELVMVDFLMLYMLLHHETEEHPHLLH